MPFLIKTVLLNLFIAVKMAYSYCFSLGKNLDFPDFLQKHFYNIDLWKGTKVEIEKSRWVRNESFLPAGGQQRKIGQNNFINKVFRHL